MGGGGHPVVTMLVATLLAQSCGTAEVCGFHYFNDGLCSMKDAYLNERLLAYPGKQLGAFGDRADDGVAAVVVGNLMRRDSGIAFEVRRGPTHADSVLEVTNEGDVSLSCPSVASNRECRFVDASGVSGHWSLTCMPAYYVTVAGRLSENHLNVALDGGCDTLEADGGCYLAFAARHGELTVVSSEPRLSGGWGIQYTNPVTDGTGPERFFVDVWGGIGQRHLMIRAQFPKCPADIVVTQPQMQLYVNGALESTQLYAFDEHRWYFCNGTQWEAQ